MSRQTIIIAQAPVRTSSSSQAGWADSIVYVSGQIALSAQGWLVGEGDVIAQTHWLLKNLTAMLAAAGISNSLQCCA